MSHTIFIHNKSPHDQTFQVHGWNNNQDINIGGGQTATINAPDGSSGAIIAVHDGQVGEQAEITKNGFGGNDFIDLSNICGAGGNLTVCQVGDLSTLKGDPDFMQKCNTAWQNADQGTKDSLQNCVFFNGDGSVRRIGAPKDFPALEQFVRTFADGRTYIGVGAWNGSAGNPNDNAQSSAAHGNKDIMITFSGENAMPDGGSGGGQYTIHAGDTLWNIAQSHGESVDQLTSKNPGIDANSLQVGQVINV